MNSVVPMEGDSSPCSDGASRRRARQRLVLITGRHPSPRLFFALELQQAAPLLLLDGRGDGRHCPSSRIGAVLSDGMTCTASAVLRARLLRSAVAHADRSRLRPRSGQSTGRPRRGPGPAAPPCQPPASRPPGAGGSAVSGRAPGVGSHPAGRKPFASQPGARPCPPRHSATIRRNPRSAPETGRS